MTIWFNTTNTTLSESKRNNEPLNKGCIEKKNMKVKIPINTGWLCLSIPLEYLKQWHPSAIDINIIIKQIDTNIIEKNDTANVISLIAFVCNKREI